MARRRIPRELRRRTWGEGTVWELLTVLQALPYRFASPLADLGMTARQRRKLRCEEEVLKATRVAYLLPHLGSRSRPQEPWLYLQTKRGGHYRVNDTGVIERYGKRILRLGAGSISEHGWYTASLRSVRWIQLVADGLLLRRIRREATSTIAAHPIVLEASHEGEVEEGHQATPEQLPLFP